MDSDCGETRGSSVVSLLRGFVITRNPGSRLESWHDGMRENTGAAEMGKHLFSGTVLRDGLFYAFFQCNSLVGRVG